MCFLSFYTFHLICENCLLTADTFGWENFPPPYKTVRPVCISSQREIVLSQSGRAETQLGFPEGECNAQDLAVEGGWTQWEIAFYEQTELSGSGWFATS